MCECAVDSRVVAACQQTISSNLIPDNSRVLAGWLACARTFDILHGCGCVAGWRYINTTRVKPFGLARSSIDRPPTQRHHLFSCVSVCACHEMVHTHIQANNWTTMREPRMQVTWLVCVVRLCSMSKALSFNSAGEQVNLANRFVCNWRPSRVHACGSQIHSRESTVMRACDLLMNTLICDACGELPYVSACCILGIVLWRRRRRRVTNG